MKILILPHIAYGLRANIAAICLGTGCQSNSFYMYMCTYMYMDVVQCWCLGVATVVSQQRLVFNTAVLPLRDVFCIVRRHTQTT